MKNLLVFAMMVMALVFVQFAQAQTVDEVIDKHITALGGKENLNKIQNVISEGSLSVQGIEIGVTVTQVNNKLARQDIFVNGMTGFDMLTDKEGWTYMPFNGMQKPEPKTADDVKEGLSDLDIAGPLVDYAAKGNKVELLGKEDVDGTECYKLKVTLASGKDETYFIDPTTNMIIRTKKMQKANGQEVEVQSDFSDYRDVEGVKMPYSIGLPFGTLLISSIKVNQTIPESAYKHDM
ncbi:MAG: hypothetical protein R2765_05160 [Ferruginibacter sp.]|nr:hypothetical protein [Bacteroidota bacterium]MBX2920059.1 hypothetical protein [Ferruginibacter sp.]MCB0710078.1 hypothetical protein [Chitinophagaceae bacterium]